MFGLKKKQKKNIDDQTVADQPQARSPLGDISKMLNASGRIALPTLQKLVKVYQKSQFIVFMEQPVLVGSSIQAGSLNLRKRASKDEMNRTVVFELDRDEDTVSPTETLKHAIYPLVKGEYASGPVN